MYQDFCPTQELEQTHIAEALKNYEQSEVDLSDASHRDDKGKVVGVNDLLLQQQPTASGQQQQQGDSSSSSSARASLEESCFKEVVTRSGTRMVLSVSKTFMK